MALLRLAAAHELGDARNGTEVGRRPEPEHRRSARRTSGKSHSVATGGGASAFATATPKRSVSCSSARPQTTSRFDSRSRQRSRKSTFRAFGFNQGDLADRET